MRQYQPLQHDAASIQDQFRGFEFPLPVCDPAFEVHCYVTRPDIPCVSHWLRYIIFSVNAARASLAANRASGRVRMKAVAAFAIMALSLPTWIVSELQSVDKALSK
jgi:hypothetical protein